MESLRRVAAGEYTIDEAVPLQTLLDTAAPNADGLRIIDPVHFIETLEREYAS